MRLIFYAPPFSPIKNHHFLPKSTYLYDIGEILFCIPFAEINFKLVLFTFIWTYYANLGCCVYLVAVAIIFLQISSFLLSFANEIGSKGYSDKRVNHK